MKSSCTLRSLYHGCCPYFSMQANLIYRFHRLSPRQLLAVRSGTYDINGKAWHLSFLLCPHNAFSSQRSSTQTWCGVNDSKHWGWTLRLGVLYCIDMIIWSLSFLTWWHGVAVVCTDLCLGKASHRTAKASSTWPLANPGDAHSFDRSWVVQPMVPYVGGWTSIYHPIYCDVNRKGTTVLTHGHLGLVISQLARFDHQRLAESLP